MSSRSGQTDHAVDRRHVQVVADQIGKLIELRML